MKIIKLFYKIVFVLRQNAIKLKISYLIAEYKYLYPARITFPEGFKPHPLPDFYFDHSDSRLILHDNVTIRGKVRFLFFNGGVVEIGANTFFNAGCSINCLSKIKIGENCLFGENIKLYDHNHSYKNRHQLIREQEYTMAPIIIGNNCWIGSNVIILKGVTIGDNTVIGANCIVYKDVAAGSVLIADAGDQKLKTHQPD